MAPRMNRKRKLYRRRKAPRRMRKRTVTVNRALAPIPQRYITKLKYSDIFTLSTTNSWSYYYNLNSLWDPNRTGVGHQPYGYDQLAVLYNRYRVISCSYVVTGYSGGSVIRVGTLPLNEPITFTNMSYICENPRAQFMLQVPGGDAKMLKGKVYIPSLVGRSKSQYMADDQYQAQTNASPGSLALLGVFGSDIADLTTNVSCTITLEYTVEFFDLNPLTGS